MIANGATFAGTVFGITANMVGLGNVDNFHDVDKPISTATKSYVDTSLNTFYNKILCRWITKYNQYLNRNLITKK